MASKKSTTTTEEIFAAELRRNHGEKAEERLQEILVRMCRSLSDPQGNLLFDFLWLTCIGKNRPKLHRRFLQLLRDELFHQHDYQHEHQGQQGPPSWIGHRTVT